MPRGRGAAGPAPGRRGRPAARAGTIRARVTHRALSPGCDRATPRPGRPTRRFTSVEPQAATTMPIQVRNVVMISPFRIARGGADRVSRACARDGHHLQITDSPPGPQASAASPQAPEDLGHPLAVLGLHGAGAEADDLLGIPARHGRGGLEHRPWGKWPGPGGDRAVRRRRRGGGRAPRIRRPSRRGPPRRRCPARAGRAARNGHRPRAHW